MQSKKPLLVLFFLLFASMACYSDSPLWVFGVTDTPPTATFLPAPDADYPSRVTTEELGLAPIPSDPENPYFFVTGTPTDLLPSIRNATGSCDFGVELDVLYIGHQWENFDGSIYVDDIALSDGENTEALFDFESDSEWAIEEDGQGAGDDAVKFASNINFNDLMVADAPEALDVSNTSSVLELELNFAAEDWSAQVASYFEPGLDWSTQTTLTARAFAPAGTEEFFITTYIRVGEVNQLFTSERVALVAGEWIDISVDLTAFETDLSNIGGIGFIVGPDPANTFYLIECAGTVGWANEDRVAGPLLFAGGQSALALPVAHTGQPLPPGQPFGIYSGESPPLNTVIPPSTPCGVNEVLEVIGASSIDQEIWYQVRCTSGQSGWVRGFRLFGPLILPDSGGNGIVRADFETIELTENAGASSDENPVIGSCAANDIIGTLGFEAVEEGESQNPYYLLTCGDSVGWARQDPLLEIPYIPGETMLVVGDERRELTISTEELAEQDTSDFLPAPISSEPGIADSSNTVGECESGNNVTGTAVSTVAGLDAIFYEVDCAGISGWIQDRYLPNRVNFPVGTTIYFMTRNTDITDVVQGYEISSTATFVPNVIGVCDLYQPVEVIGTQFEQRALSRLGFRIYYELTCQSVDAEELTGFVVLDDESDTFILRNPFEFLGN